MARPKAFDEYEVLTGAMHAFRRRGYASASIKDLEQATGLKSGSIYNAFGDKDGLFLAALDHYNASVVVKRIRQHLEAAPGLAGIASLFRSLLAEPAGCLLTNCAIEVATTHPEAGAKVNEGFDLLRHGFQRSLEQAVRMRETRSGVEPAAGALQLLALYQGILVLVRAGQDSHDLATLIESALKTLRATA